MKTLLKIFFGFICLNSLISAQQNFHNIYSELGNNSYGLKVKKADNGNFIIDSIIHSKFMAKPVTDRYKIHGICYEIWLKSYNNAPKTTLL